MTTLLRTCGRSTLRVSDPPHSLTGMSDPYYISGSASRSKCRSRTVYDDPMMSKPTDQRGSPR